MKIHSADSHFNEPPKFYNSLYKKHGAIIPHIEEDKSGSFWVVNDFKRPLGVMNQPGARQDKIKTNLSINDTKYIYDLNLREKIVRKDGISFELLFPSGAMLHIIPDKQARIECFIALNDFLYELDGFYRGVLQVPNDPVDAYKIISRYNAPRFIMFPLYLPNSSYSDGNWDKCFSFCQEKGVIVCFHAGSLRYKNKIQSSVFQTHTHKTSILFFQGFELLNDLIIGGVLKKFNNLKFLISELGVSWIPYWIHRIETGLSIYGSIDKIEHIKIKPILRKNFFFTTQFDYPSLETISLIGDQNTLFGSDYPHVESTHGQTKKILKTIIDKYGKHYASNIFYRNLKRLIS